MLQEIQNYLNSKPVYSIVVDVLTVVVGMFLVWLLICVVGTVFNGYYGGVK